MGHVLTTKHVLPVLLARPNQTVSLGELKAATGLQEAQIQASLNNLMRRKQLPIRTILRGQLWIYEPEKETASPASKPEPETPVEKPSTVSGQLYVIGKTKDGALVLESPETGILYRAEEL